MDESVLKTVHTLLERSGQAVPAKHIARDDRSLEVYDVEHWPELFNSILRHDFPSLSISIDSSVVSLSGFIVTLTWSPAVDASKLIASAVYLTVLTVILCFVLRTCSVGMTRVPIEKLTQLTELYNGPLNFSGPSHSKGSSLLADQLHALMARSDL
jgi:hypothetical protein